MKYLYLVLAMVAATPVRAKETDNEKLASALYGYFPFFKKGKSYTFADKPQVRESTFLNEKSKAYREALNRGKDACIVKISFGTGRPINGVRSDLVRVSGNFRSGGNADFFVTGVGQDVLEMPTGSLDQGVHAKVRQEGRELFLRLRTLPGGEWEIDTRDPTVAAKAKTPPCRKFHLVQTPEEAMNPDGPGAQKAEAADSSHGAHSEGCDDSGEWMNSCGVGAKAK